MINDHLRHDFTGKFSKRPSFSEWKPEYKGKMESMFREFLASRQGVEEIKDEPMSVKSQDLEIDTEGYPILPPQPVGGDKLQHAKKMVRSFIKIHYRKCFPVHSTRCLV